jgi:hypothetical protein
LPSIPATTLPDTNQGSGSVRQQVPSHRAVGMASWLSTRFPFPWFCLHSTLGLSGDQPGPPTSSRDSFLDLPVVLTPSS